MALTFQSLAFGELRKDPVSNRYRASLIGVANVGAMPAEPRRYLADHLAALAERSEEYGHAQPGWWVDGAPPQEIQNLLPGRGGDYGGRAGAALARLTAVTPGTASPGLLAIIEFTAERPSLAVLKLDINDEDLYRFASQAQAESVIRYEHLTDVLPATGTLKKAALVPNPCRADANLRVVDDEAVEGTATYWLNFLGAMVIPPAPRVLKTVIELTKGVVCQQVGETRSRQAIARVLQEVSQSRQATPARQFVRRVAEECDVEADPVWEAVQARAGVRLPEQASISPASLERLQTEIVFHAGGQQVTVRGPAEAIEGRYRWEATAGGYDLTIRTDDEPRVRTTLKPGRPSGS